METDLRLPQPELAAIQKGNRAIRRSEGGSIQLGSMQTYLFRMSFFKIEIRPIGEKGYVNLEPDTIFCIKHNNPSEVFNSFRIEFADVTRADATEFEIRFHPVPGNYVLDHYRDMIILDTRKNWQPNTVQQFPRRSVSPVVSRLSGDNQQSNHKQP